MENITPQGIMFATLVITLWFLPLYKILEEDGSFTTKVILFFEGAIFIYNPDFKNNLIQVISENKIETMIELVLISAVFLIKDKNYRGIVFSTILFFWLAALMFKQAGFLSFLFNPEFIDIVAYIIILKWWYAQLEVNVLYKINNSL